MQLQYTTTAIVVRLIHIYVSIAAPLFGFKEEERRDVKRRGGCWALPLWAVAEDRGGKRGCFVSAAEYQKIFYLYIFFMCKIPVHIKFFTAATCTTICSICKFWTFRVL